MKAHLSRHSAALASSSRSLFPAAAIIRGADWPDWRGPARTGVSTETGLPAKWSAGRREPGVAGAVRRPLGPGGVRRSPVPPEHVRLRRDRAGAPDVLQRRHRQAALGAPLQHVHERRAAASPRLVVAGRRSGDRQRVRDQRQRPGHVAARRTARCCGSDRSPKSSGCGRRTAGGCRRRSSTAIS